MGDSGYYPLGPNEVLTHGGAFGILAIVPVFNAMEYLDRTAPSLIEAAEDYGPVQIVFVDNGSEDGSYEYLTRIRHPQVSVHCMDGTIGSLRNFGASVGNAPFLSFIDADCLVSSEYFRRAIETVSNRRVSATGSYYALPKNPHWIEATWFTSHRPEGDRPVRFLPGGNFFVSREAFEDVGGFNEELTTGEDAEIGERLNNHGHTLWHSASVTVIHLGNAKTLRQWFRQNVWHSLGMFGTRKGIGLDKLTIMLFLHLGLTGAGIGLLVFKPDRFFVSLPTAVFLQLVAPVLSLGYRAGQSKKVPRILPLLLLYWVYYWARAYGLLLILGRRSFRK